MFCIEDDSVVLITLIPEGETLMLENLVEGQKVFMRSGEYEFLVARHRKYDWLQQGHQYMYFLYIVRKQEKVINANGDTRTFNILCHIQLFLNYFHLFKTLQPVLEEYVLENERIIEFILEAREMCYEDTQLQVDLSDYLEE